MCRDVSISNSNPVYDISADLNVDVNHRYHPFLSNQGSLRASHAGRAAPSLLQPRRDPSLSLDERQQQESVQLQWVADTEQLVRELRSATPRPAGAQLILAVKSSSNSLTRRVHGLHHITLPRAHVCH